MTREERGMAIEFFKFRRRIFCDNHLKNCPKNSNEYQATLIEKTFYDIAIKTLEQESCEDAVSRQAVKEQMIYYGFHAPDMTVTEFVKDCLQSVNPQKIGHWIIDKEKLGYYISKCSACGHIFHGNEILIYRPKYCANCGAKMIEPQESEVE